MSSDASSTLSPEIQQAIQQAVGNVNDAANVNKQKKKRNREQAETDQSDKPRKQHKKKKKQRTEEDGTNGVVIGQSSTATSIAASDTEAVTRNDDTPLPEKKKKRRKDKGKEKAQEEPVAQVQPESIYLDNDSATSSVDFLSLVVAAANATASAQPQEQQPPPTGYPPHMQPYPQYPEQYLAYPPPPGYPYPPPAHYPAPPPNVYPESSGLAIPDLNITTSEELLQTLQSMDITKIASVLKSLGDVGAAANVSVNNTQPVVTQPVVPGPLNPAPIRQTPAKSEAILGHAPRPAKKKVFPAPPSPPPGDEHNPNHAHMLANVWLNPGKLADLVKREGLVYKKGKFSAIEEALLEAAIARYKESRGLEEEDVIDIIFQKEKGRDSFWTEITSALHLRPIIAVYHHVRRTYHPLAKRGKWTEGEDKELEQAVNELGLQWERVANRVCRAASDCRDRYRNHILDKSIRIAGPWSRAEEEELTEIVTEMTVKQGKNMDNDVFWSVVSEKMGNRRGRQQCRIKWTDSLSTQYKNDGQRPRWSALDAYILIRKIDSLSIHDDTEIDWKTLPDDEWNYWSAHSLQRRWLNMKRGIRGFEEMSHPEIMEILRNKKGQLPPEISHRKRAKVTSAEAVDDSDDEDFDDDEDLGTNNTAGPSSQAIPPPIIAM